MRSVGELSGAAPTQGRARAACAPTAAIPTAFLAVGLGKPFGASVSSSVQLR